MQLRLVYYTVYYQQCTSGNIYVVNAGLNDIANNCNRRRERSNKRVVTDDVKYACFWLAEGFCYTTWLYAFLFWPCAYSAFADLLKLIPRAMIALNAVRCGYRHCRALWLQSLPCSMVTITAVRCRGHKATSWWCTHFSVFYQFLNKPCKVITLSTVLSIVYIEYAMHVPIMHLL